MKNEFTEKIKELINSVPEGKVATYGQIAALAGNPRAARQVAWVLNSSSRKDKLPWFRIINSRGTISLPRGAGFEEQKSHLESENIAVDEKGRINLKQFGWLHI